MLGIVLDCVPVIGSWGGCQEDESWRSLNGSFDHWFPIEIRGPVHQVEGPKQHREHYPGHLVNLAHTVVSLFGVRGLGFRRLQLNSCAIWNGGDGRVLRDVGCVIHTSWTGVVWLFRQSQRILLLWGKSKSSTEWTLSSEYKRSCTYIINIYTTFTKEREEMAHGESTDPLLFNSSFTLLLCVICPHCHCCPKTEWHGGEKKHRVGRREGKWDHGRIFPCV